MARKTMWAVVGALLAFAPAASAATYTLAVSGALTYAKEMKSFGVDYDDEGPKLVLTLLVDATEAANIAADDFMDVKIDLSGATFAENVKNSSITFNDPGATCEMQHKDTVGGDRGTSSVTFQVEADVACGSASHLFVATFELPPLTAVGRSDVVTARVRTSTPGGNDWPATTQISAEMPGTGAVHVGTNACATPAANCVHVAANGELRVLGDPVAAGRGGAEVPLIRFANALTQTVATGGGSSQIDFDGGREDFVGSSGTAHFANVSVGVTAAGACTGDDPIPAGCVRQSDGKEFRISRNGEGRGEMYVAVFGDFREDDMVFLDINGNGDPDRSEMLSLEDDGSMAGAFTLLSLAGNSRAAMGDAGSIDREEGLKSDTRLVYQPNEEDALRPSEFRVRAIVVFEVQQSVADPEDRFDFEAWRAGGGTTTGSQGTTFSTTYSVIESTQRSYAIPDLDGSEGDIGNLRIKCEVSTACTVYLECDGGEGGYWFGELDDPIDGRATVRLSAADIAEVLNVADDDPWMNGLQCAVLSTRMISVQSLTRAGGVLVNHTYIARD